MTALIEAGNAEMNSAKSNRRKRKAETAKPMVEAVAYLRTSSDFNAQDGKDSEPRQREAIERYAEWGGYTIADGDWFNDPGVSGTLPVTERPGFMALLNRIAENGVRVVLVEDEKRFARHMAVSEAGVALLVKMGVRVLTASGVDLTETDDPTKVAIRQMLGVMAQLEAKQIAKRLRHGREAAKAAGKPIGGKAPMHVARPDVVREAKRLRRRNPTTGDVMSYARIAEALARLGHLSTAKRKGDEPRPFSASAVQGFCDGPMPARANDSERE